MKTVLFAVALPALLAAGSSLAMPLAPIQAEMPIERVQMRCDQNSCIDTRTGVYTKSGCDRRGCYPISGARGRVGPYGDERFYPPDRPRRGYDGYYGRPRYREW